MAHKLETAHISFGLVTIPVGSYSAIDEQDIHFHQLHSACVNGQAKQVAVNVVERLASMNFRQFGASGEAHTLCRKRAAEAELPCPFLFSDDDSSLHQAHLGAVRHTKIHVENGDDVVPTIKQNLGCVLHVSAGQSQ